LIGPIEQEERFKMTNLEIRGLIETSFLDWDGKIVATIYVPRCNFRCPFCHNSGLIENPDHHEIIPLEKIEDLLLKHKDFMDGICLTGGEPTLHNKKGLLEFIKRIKNLGFLVKFDSNGTSPETLQDLIKQKLIDYIAMDIKGPLDQRYDKLSGVKTNLHKIKQSIEIIMTSGLAYEFRTTVVASLLDTGDIEDIARHIAGAEKFVLQQFVPEHTWAESLRSVKAYERSKLEEMAQVAKPYVTKTLIRGA